jgi:hypothetical protein
MRVFLGVSVLVSKFQPTMDRASASLFRNPVSQCLLVHSRVKMPLRNNAKLSCPPLLINDPMPPTTVACSST